MGEKETEKVKLNAYIPRHLAEEFRQAARLSYGQIGLCLSAAMLKFLELAVAEQEALIRRVYEAEEAGKIPDLIASTKAKQTAQNGPVESKRK